jgi:hypothetical protein
MAPAFGAVIATLERRDPTASAVARPVNKAPVRRAVITTPQSGGPFARVPPASNTTMSARIEAAGPRPLGARFTRAGPACRTRPSKALSDKRDYRYSFRARREDDRGSRCYGSACACGLSWQSS